jgi:predicted amidophosphoribosyltransferase
VATARELTDPNISMYVPPPPAGAGVCSTCHGSWPWADECWSCRQTRGGVEYSVGLIVPISLARKDQAGQLYDVLRGYKGSRDPDVRWQHQLHIAALLYRFLHHHRPHIAAAAGRDYDTITIVPSKSGREGQHPLEASINLVKPLRESYVRMLEPGPGTIGRNAPAVDGFVSGTDLRGRRVLLIDDTFTTGAKVQSAAHALSFAGNDVVAALVVGRLIDVQEPDATTKPHIAELMNARSEFWKQQAAKQFSFDTCCLE